MELLYVTVEGFRRFRDEVSVRLREQLVALVGINESGKSSFLEGLERLNDDEPFEDTDYACESESAPPRISATFSLGEKDAANLRQFDGIDERTCFTVTKNASGKRSVEFEPPLIHDLAPRRAALAMAESIQENPIIANRGNQSRVRQVRDLIMKALDILARDSTYLGEQALSNLQSLVDVIESMQGDEQTSDEEQLAPILEFGQCLRRLIVHEEACIPYHASTAVLATHPRFVLFDAESRALQSAYDLRKVADEPPKALENLANFVGLDLKALYEVMSNERVPRIKELLQRANNVLAARITDTWIDGRIIPQLHDRGTTLHILVSERDRSFDLHQRSDGFRWFLALLAFLDGQDQERETILLIDEAETHLSYDAQAHLVSALENYRWAKKVIYTTHSAGCLPSDLGTGIRPVIPSSTDVNVSRIANSFWTLGEPGFTPLFLTMGLAPLAFAPARNVLIGEGPSEMLLLPSLIREATGLEILPYQVAPGAAEVGRKGLRMLLSQAARVAFVLDGDGAGVERGEELVRWGATQEQVRTYFDFAREPLTLEDFVSADAFAEAYNKELKVLNGVAPTLMEDEVPELDRMNDIDRRFKAQGIESSVCKTVLCQRLAEMAAGGRKILEERRSVPLRALHDWLREQFVPA